MKKQPKTLKYLLFALGAAAVAGGGYYAWSKSMAQPANKSVAPLPAAPLVPAAPVKPYKPTPPIIPKPVQVPAPGKAGASVYPRNASLNVRKQATTQSASLFVVNKGIKAGLTTGQTAKKADGLWHEISTAKGKGWVRADVVTISYV